VLLADWPEDWARRYFGHGYLSRDPAIRRVRAVAAPFEWSDLDDECRDDSAARRVMDEAGEHGLSVGLTIPLATLDGHAIGLSFAGERAELAPEERGALVLLANYALSRAMAMRQSERPPSVPLTPREREALQWAAEGQSDGEIGVLMGITDHGVDRHMRAVRQKLGTRSRTHAVAQAIRLGLIR
jgi:LuxR family quorum sensing-dependent transcriptional regulator